MAKKLLVVSGVAVVVAAAVAFGSVSYSKSKFRDVLSQAEKVQSPVEGQTNPMFKIVEQESDGFFADKYKMNMSVGNVSVPFELLANFGLKTVKAKFNVEEKEVGKLIPIALVAGLGANDFANKFNVSPEEFASLFSAEDNAKLKQLVDYSLFTYDVIPDKLTYSLAIDNLSTKEVIVKDGKFNIAIGDISKGYVPEKLYTEIGFDKLTLADLKADFGKYELKSGFDSGYYFEHSLKSFNYDGGPMGKLNLEKASNSIKASKVNDKDKISVSYDFKIDEVGYDGDGMKVAVDDFDFDLKLNDINLHSVMELCPERSYSSDCALKLNQKFESPESADFISKFFDKDTNAKMKLNAKINKAKLNVDVDFAFDDNFSFDNPLFNMKADASLETKIFETLPILGFVAGPVKSYAVDPDASVLEYHLAIEKDKITLNGKPLN